MTGKITVIAYHWAKPGKEGALREALLAVCAPTRAEQGCLKFRALAPAGRAAKHHIVDRGDELAGQTR